MMGVLADILIFRTVFREITEVISSKLASVRKVASCLAVTRGGKLGRQTGIPHERDRHSWNSLPAFREIASCLAMTRGIVSFCKTPVFTEQKLTIYFAEIPVKPI